MDRLRIANKVIVANAYETLRNKLLKRYKHLLEDAKKYKDGEIKGFVFPHLNFRTDNMLPTLKL